MKSEKEIKKYLEMNEGKNSKPYDSENTILIKELEAILEAAGQLEKPRFEKEKVYTKIQATIAKGTEDVKSPGGRTISLYKWISGIASILVLILIGSHFINNQIQVSAGAETLTYLLPDESKIVLDKHSTITYNKDFLNERTLNLEGEAFFEVKEGRKFSVSTSLGTVSVLGTSFNVIDRNGSLLVSCKTGKVKVDMGKQSAILTPGDQIRFSGDQVYKSKLEKLNSIDAWVTGQPYFDSVPLNIVIDKLSNQYDTKIVLPSKYHELIFTGTYMTTDFHKALKMVFSPMEIEYTIKPDGTVVF